MIDDIGQLKSAVEKQHGGNATHIQSVPVSESFEGQKVWEGIVHVFDLEGHPKAKRVQMLMPTLSFLL